MMSSGKWKDSGRLPGARTTKSKKLTNESISIEMAKERVRMIAQDDAFCASLQAAIDAGLEHKP